MKELEFQWSAYPHGDENKILQALRIYCYRIFIKFSRICKQLDKLLANISETRNYFEIAITLGSRIDHILLLKDPFFITLLNRLEKYIEDYACTFDKKIVKKITDLFEIIVFQLICILGDGINYHTLNLTPSIKFINPIGVHWSLKSNINYELNLSVSSHYLLLKSDENGILVEIPFSDLNDRSNGENIKISQNKKNIQIDHRVFTSKDFTEIVPLSYFPELNIDDSTQCIDFELINNEWNRSISKLSIVWPEALVDIKYFCRAICPIIAPHGKWYSGTSPSTPFVQRLTFHKNANEILTLEEIIHESSHVKLEIQNQITPLILNDDSCIYGHPWRPDKRPMRGVLFAVHAFLAVAAMLKKFLEYETQEEWVEEYYLETMNRVKSSLNTLEKYALFTKEGELFFSAIDKYYKSI